VQTVANGQLGATPNPAIEGQAVLLTSTWSGALGNATGSVEFRSNGNPISGCASVSMVVGVASCTTTFSAAGNRQLSALYGGNTNYLAGAVGPLVLVVRGNQLFANGFE